MLPISEFIELLEARWKRTNRIRGGKVQRRKVVRTDKAFKTKADSSVERMSASERRKRSLSQKRASRKRKAKSKRSNRKRKITLRKRKTLGFD